MIIKSKKIMAIVIAATIMSMTLGACGSTVTETITSTETASVEVTQSEETNSEKPDGEPPTGEKPDGELLKENTAVPAEHPAAAVQI